MAGSGNSSPNRRPSTAAPDPGRAGSRSRQSEKANFLGSSRPISPTKGARVASAHPAFQPQIDRGTGTFGRTAGANGKVQDADALPASICPSYWYNEELQTTWRDLAVAVEKAFSSGAYPLRKFIPSFLSLRWSAPVTMSWIGGRSKRHAGSMGSQRSHWSSLHTVAYAQ